MSEPTSNFIVQEPSIYQLDLLEQELDKQAASGTYRDRLIYLLSGNLDYHGYDTSYASHDFHAFPAKFPPPLPETFIRGLTGPGDTVLDPMMGSGTAIVEAFLAGRTCIGTDIDPLALLIATVKTTPLDVDLLREHLHRIITDANLRLEKNPSDAAKIIDARWDKKTRGFVNYWFAAETKNELAALLVEIEKIADVAVQAFFTLAFSACIITKTGGVSLAFDLAHTRPHRAKVAFTVSGEKILGTEYEGVESKRIKFLTKNLRSAIIEFRKRAIQNIKSISELTTSAHPVTLQLADAQRLPVETSTVDLIVTSPPYAVNAIDYMRANKFSLVWLGYLLDQLGETRKLCVGGESTTSFAFEALPPKTTAVVTTIAANDTKRGKALERYYSEMTRVLREMQRVLKPDRAAVLVVASSEIRQIDTQTQICLAEIGETVGFEVPKIGTRRLDRNRRMMPAGHKIDGASQIQKRMHEEYVIGFYKSL
jgi:DNA modification methylase